MPLFGLGLEKTSALGEGGESANCEVWAEYQLQETGL